MKEDPPLTGHPKIETVDLQDHGTALVMDGLLAEEALDRIDAFRVSLPLDSKRPTVDRRFFVDKAATTGPFLGDDKPHDRVLATILERAIQSASSLLTSSPGQGSLFSSVHVLRYMRFLEYVRPGQGLDCHTDGTKTCEDTLLVSTHTMLLYLTDCAKGGETVLMLHRHNSNNSDSSVVRAEKPKRGRILLFPHRAWHQGASVVDVPKICLRSEVCLVARKDSCC